MYADDSHLRWRFDTYQGFEQAMNEMRIVFACFRRFSLRINMEKTKAILKVVGTLKHRLKKEYIRKHDEQRRLLLSARNPDSWLTLVLSTEYLGLIISYDSFEQQSLRHRLQKAHGRRWALASVLHSNRLSIQYKLNIWRSCVYTTLRYGLVHCGLNGDQVADMQRAVMKHTRAIVNNQAFLTGDTHETIIQKYRLPRVLQDMAAELQQARDTQCQHLDWLYSDAWQQHLEAQLSLPPRSTENGDETTHAWACPFCEHMFPTSAALKHHARRTHNYVDKTGTIFSKAVHSVGGLPTCRFCRKDFSRWQTLAQHITSNSCPSFDAASQAAVEAQQEHHNEPADKTADNAVAQPISCMTDVQQAARRGVNAFIPLKHVTAQLRQSCALCGQWVASHRCMKRHYQYSHKQLLETLGSDIQTLIHRTATACPTCHYCNVRCKDWRMHIQKCTVVWQCAILHLQERGGRAPRVLRDSALGPTRGTPAEASPPSTDSRPRRATKGPSLVDYFSPTCSSAGGGDQGPQAGPRARGLPEARRTQHTTSSLPNSQSVPGQATKQPHMDPGTAATQDSHGYCAFSGAGGAAGAHVHRGDDRYKSTGTRLERPGHRLEVSTVEPDIEVSGAGHNTKAAHGPNGEGLTVETHTISGGRHGPSLQCHQEASGHSRGEHHISTRPLHPHATGPRSMDGPPPTTGQRGATTGGVAYKRETLRPSPIAKKIKETLRRS